VSGKSTDKPRLDALLHQRGFFDSRAGAQAAVMAGEVYVDGRCIDKAGTRVAPGVHIKIKPRSLKYVSRGGRKLEGAIRDMAVDIEGKVVLDVGASTGGFTDCLLKHGARKVYALDVGHGLIDEKLRVDRRVVLLERVNVRRATPDMFDEQPEMAVVDVSFISLKLVLPVLKSFGIGTVIALVKPQFEVGRADASRGKGVIRDPKTRKKAINGIIFFAESVGFKVVDKAQSVLSGPKGNVETFIYMELI